MTVQPREKVAQRDLIHVYKYLMGEKRIGSWTLLSGVLQTDRRLWAQTEMEEIPFKHRKNIFCPEDCQTLQHVAYRGCGVLIVGDTKNLPGHCPEQRGLVDLALSSGVGLAEVQRCLPTSVFLQFCDLPASSVPRCWCPMPSRLSRQLLSTTALGCSFLYFQKFRLPRGR